VLAIFDIWQIAIRLNGAIKCTRFVIGYIGFGL